MKKLAFRSLVLVFSVLGCGLGAALYAGCGEANAGCSDEPDVTGAWVVSLSPLAADAGVRATIPEAATLDAQLLQGGSTDFLNIGRHLYGTLSARDPSYFGTLEIPRLMHNDGGKSGAVLGCALRINVPIATPVTDDNVDQGPLRITLAGKIIGKGSMLGTEGSRLILASDPTQTDRAFVWSAVRR